MNQERVKHKLSAILSADVVGYSRLMGEDEVSTVQTLEAYRKVISDLIEQFRGRVVDSPEDGLAELNRTYHNDDKLSNYDLSLISMWAAYFGDHEFALEAMEKAVGSNGSDVGRLWCPVMKEVRQLPRFKEFVKEIGLVDYWKEYGWPDNHLCYSVSDDDFLCE